MASYPNTVHFTGLNRPISIEWSAHNLAVEGTIPDEIDGAFFRAVPGMQEWTLLGKAWWHTTETRPDGSWLYDVVILDAPATGHGLDMLRVPKIILDVVPPGLLRRDAERAWKMLQDPATCAVVLVTLPEEMPTTETIELAKALREELQLPIGKIVVNGVLPPLVDARPSAPPSRTSIWPSSQIERFPPSIVPGTSESAVVAIEQVEPTVVSAVVLRGTVKA
jgi:hypothetical protein